MFSNAPRLFKSVFFILILYLTVFLVILPQNCLSAAKEGIDMCLNTVIPSLFPFFVCSGLLSASGFSIMCGKILSPFMRPLFRLPGASALTFLLGTVSGYPVGAASASELYESGQCTKNEAERMIAFCNNSSPLFVIGVVGTGFLGNPSLGYLLYASHIISALIVGIIFRFYGNASSSNRKTLPPSTSPRSKKNVILSFGGIIDSSVSSTLKVCGFIIFFSVFSEAIPENFLKPYICSLTEISGGLLSLTQATPSHNMLLPLISFFLGFSGLSILLQITSITSPKGLSAKLLIPGKILQGVISCIMTLFLTKIFPISQPTSTFPQTNFMDAFSASDLILSAILSTFFVIMILKGVMHLSFLFSGRNTHN